MMARHWAWALALFAVVASSACSTRVFDAVVGDVADLDASVPMTDAGAARRDAEVDEDAATVDSCQTDADGCEVWPNATSHTNSDPWLVAHHGDLRELRPRVLVLDFINELDVAAVAAAAEAVIDGIAEGSRYHAYQDPDAPAFLRYELAGVIDLTDDPVPADWPYSSSSQVPVTSDGAFDVSALFSIEFAAHYGFEDPERPGAMLGLCELFSGGHINELWLAVAEGNERHPPQALECKARYDASGQRVEGAFADITADNFCALAATCGVTVRMAHLNPRRGVGCDLDIRGWLLRHSYRALPGLEANMRAFMNGDYRERFGAPFDSLLELCGDIQGDCVRYPSSSVAEGELRNGTSWRIDPYQAGCGDPEYPPNARFMLDGDNPDPVLSRCADFGLRGGSGGQDLYAPYSAATIADLEARWGRDCAGGWQVYFRQSLPGLDTQARGDDGEPLKNWWVYSFY